jgi:hypothetical protein
MMKMMPGMVMMALKRKNHRRLPTMSNTRAGLTCAAAGADGHELVVVDAE